MFQGLAFGALGVDLSQVCDANGQNCTYVQTPTGPGLVMPTGPQPAGTVLACDHASDTDPGTCYWAKNSPNTTAAQKVAAAQAPASFMGLPITTLMLGGLALVVGVAVLSKGK